MPRRSATKAPHVALISRAEAARLKGVQRSSVSKACHQGGALEAAVRGSQLDPSDPAFETWLTEPQRGPDASAVGAPAAAPTKAEMLELSRRKRAAEAEKLELANAQTRGALIARELVRTHVFGALEATNKRLLGDAAKAIASKVFNATRAKGTLEDAVRLVREEISKQLRTTKDRVTRVLRRDDTAVPLLSAPAKRRARKVAKT